MANIGVVIPCRNLVELTYDAVQSIQSELHKIHLVIIDDFSTDKTKEFTKALLESNPGSITVFTDPLTYSLSEKWNMGVNTCFEKGCDYVIVANNDIVFHPATIDALVKRMEKGDVGMVTAHNIRGHQVNGEFLSKHNLDQVVVPEEPTEAPHPDFSCFMLNKHTWEVVGEFDTKFTPCYFEDSDYHLRMGKAGIKAISTTSAPYLHYGSRTQNATPGGVCRPPQFEKLREYLRSKHGTVPGEPAYDSITTGTARPTFTEYEKTAIV